VECPVVSSQQDRAGNREVFRSVGSIILWWVWVAIAIAALIDVAAQTSGRSAVVMALLVVAVTGALYGLAFRPRIVADAGGITLENPLRDYRAPWGTVEQVDAANALRVHCAAPPGASQGKILHSWAVQYSPRAARAAQARSRRALAARPAVGYAREPAQAQQATPPRGSAEATARQLDERARRERAAGAAGGPPEARWAWLSIAVMVVPLVAFIVVALT
jgi:hypothetical protein